MRQRSLLCGALAGALGVSACNGDSAWPLQDQVLVVTASGRDAGAASELEQTAVTAVTAGQPDDAGSIDAIAVEAGSMGAASSPRWPSEEGMAGACVGELADFCGGTDCPTFDETLDEAQARGARWGTRSHCEGPDGRRYVTLSVLASIYVHDPVSGSLVSVISFSDAADLCPETAPSAILVSGAPPGDCAYVNHDDPATFCAEASGWDGGALETCMYDFSTRGTASPGR